MPASTDVDKQMDESITEDYVVLYPVKLVKQLECWWQASVKPV